MIEDGIIKIGDVIFIYSQPVENALVGVVRDIKYPLLFVRAINRQSEKKFESEKIVDIMKEKALTILDENKIKRILTGEERKKINKEKKVLYEVVNDIFG
jgi:hypothetical protein